MRTIQLRHQLSRLPIQAGMTALCALATLSPDLTANPRALPGPWVSCDDGDVGIERLSEWPKLVSKTSSSKEITRLRKARTEEMGTEAASALVDSGASVVPLLLKSLAKEKDEDARVRIVAVLDAICGAAHTRLLAQEFDNRSQNVRRWALNKVALTPDEGVRDAAEAALASAAKGSKEDGEQAAEQYAAALCVTSAGSLAGLDTLYGAAILDWKGNGTSIRRALEVVRGPKAAEQFWASVDSGDRKHRIATLRMLAGCGEKAGARKLSGMLDDTDNGIRVAAINALRGMVDGEPPLVKLATFAAIEKALKWKERL